MRAARLCILNARKRREGCVVSGLRRYLQVATESYFQRLKPSFNALSPAAQRARNKPGTRYNYNLGRLLSPDFLSYERFR